MVTVDQGGFPWCLTRAAVQPVGRCQESIWYPVLASPSVADRLVWMAPIQHFLRGNADEVAEQCERTYTLSSVSEYSLPQLSKQRLQGQADAQVEMHQAGVQGVGGLWEGRPHALPPAPVRMDLGRLAAMANKHDAVVVNLVRGGMGADGRIARLLFQMGVKHIGSSFTTCEACWDKVALQEMMVGMEESGIYVTPKVEMTTDVLLGGSINAEDASDLLQALQVALDDATTLVVKPNMEAGGCGVAVLDSAEDVVLYFEAFRQGWPLLRANSLSVPHPAIMLPPFMPVSFVFEPYIPSDRICLSSSGGFTWAGQADEEGSNPWVEVKIALVGHLGSMRALPPSLVAWTDTDGSSGGKKVSITPVPSWCASPEAISECVVRARLVAERLALQGVAVLDAFMHCETGELYVLEVNTQPDLSSNSPIFAQAHVGNGNLPTDLARHLVHLAITPAPDAELGSSSLPPLVTLDEDEAFLDAIDLFGDEGEEGGDGEGQDAAVAPNALLDSLSDDGDDELYNQDSDILFKEGLGEQDDDLDDDTAFDDDDTLFSFSER